MHKLRSHLGEQIAEGDTTDKRIIGIGFWSWVAYIVLSALAAVNSIVILDLYQSGIFLSWL